MTIFTTLKKFVKKYLKYIIYIFVSLLATFFAHSCANAQAISNNLRTISDTYLDYFKSVGSSSNYKNFIITSSYNDSSYSRYTTYYLCLTNDDIDTSDSLHLNVSCDVFMTYYTYNNTYTYDIKNNENLILSNVIYYSYSNVNYSHIFLFCILLISCCIFLILLFNRIFPYRLL